MIRIALAVLLGVPCMAETLVALRLSARAERHVRESHFAEGRRSKGKSLFLKDTDLLKLLKTAAKARPRREANGRDKRVVGADAVIGTDGRSGKSVKTCVVIAEPDGEVVTMYPGR